MKKVLSLVLALSLAVSIASCGANLTSGNEYSISSISDGADTADSAAPSVAPDDTGKRYKVAMICDSNISDGGWGAACYNAMIDAASSNGWETAYSDSIDPSAYYEAIVSYCARGYDLIYAPGNQYTDAALKAAEEYPGVAFALLNGNAETPENAVNGNVTSLLPNASQIGWIAGAMAGLMTKTGIIAFIGGMELDTTKEKYEGYKEAAAYVAGQAGRSATTLDVVYSNSFSDGDKGIDLAREMMAQGADVFFGDASAVDSGVRRAIDEANHAANSIHVYDIAQPSDCLGQNECIIASQVTDNASLVGLSMQAVEDGSFGGEVIYGTLQNGVLSAGRVSNIVPADVAAVYQEYITQMIADKFMK